MTLKTPRPQTAKIQHTKFKTVDSPNEPLASAMTAVRLPESIHRLIGENLPDGGQKSAWLRRVIGSAAIAEFKPITEVEQVAPNNKAVSTIERAIAYLDSQCDGCETEDGRGFNGSDTGFGKWLAKRLRAGDPLLQNHAVRAYKMLQKYKRTQLKPAGIILPEWEEIAEHYPDQVTFKKVINGELCIPQRRIEVRGENLAVFTPYDVSGQFQLIARTFKGTFNYKKLGGDDSWRFSLDLETISKVLRQWPEPTYHHDPAIFGVIAALESDRLAEIAKQEAAALDVAKSIGDLVGDLDGQFKNGWSLREYQKRGVEWLISHGKGRIMRGGILADQMGLGKTLTAAVAAKKLQQQTGCAVLIVAPVSLQETWARTAEIVEVEVEITTNSHQKIFKPLQHREYLLIADEAHRFQNPKAQCTIAFLELAKHPNCIAVWPLTGTPIKNGRPINLFPLLEAVDHPLARDKKHYERYFCNAGYRTINKAGRSVWDVSGSAHLNELAEATKDAILQRTKADCLPELPEKTRLFKEAEISDATARNYKQEIDRLVADYRQRAKDGLVDPNSEALATLNILRRVGSLAKAEAAVELASETIEAGSQVIVFTEFLESAKLIAEALGAELLTGETPPENRQAMCDRFQSGQHKAIVGTIKAGGVGLTLTAASDVILVDRPWTPGDTEQAEDRAHRLGQKNPVFATWLQYGAIDAAIDGVIHLKQDNIDIVMRGKKKTLKNIKSAADLARQLMAIL
jgi:superfamily II DNA or RNA helicase